MILLYYDLKEIQVIQSWLSTMFSYILIIGMTYSLYTFINALTLSLSHVIKDSSYTLFNAYDTLSL